MKTFECKLRGESVTVLAREPTSAARKAFGSHYMSHWEEVKQSGVEIIEVETGKSVFVELVDHG